MWLRLESSIAWSINEQRGDMFSSKNAEPVLDQTEAMIVVVGFLGAGKTTLLKKLLADAKRLDWSPYIILNDYENAQLDAAQLATSVGSSGIKSLTGSCICCSGITELREAVNRIPHRQHGITFIEANGTTDACSLMGFLGVGIHKRFKPPVQISVVDVKNWQERAEHNELEANQIQVSSLIVLTHCLDVPLQRRNEVVEMLSQLNPTAKVVDFNDFDIALLPQVSPSGNVAHKLEHSKAHWASCSVDLPRLPSIASIKTLCDHIPASILRIKGCTQIGEDRHFTYFERTPDSEIYVRLYKGEPITGAKLLTIGPGSNLNVLKQAILKAVNSELMTPINK